MKKQVQKFIKKSFIFKCFLFLYLLLTPILAIAGAESVPYEFKPGNVLYSDEINKNFEHIIKRSWEKTGEGDLYHNNGNIGIGTATPNEKLSVEGIIKTSGGIKFSDGTTQITAASIEKIINVIAGPGLTGDALEGEITLSVDNKTIQSRVSGICDAGTSIREIKEDGTVICGNHIEKPGFSGNCKIGESIRAIEDDGSIICDPSITSLNAGFGLTGGAESGDASVSVDITKIQARVNSTCKVGSFIREIKSDGDGDVVCETDMGGVWNSTELDIYYNLGKVGIGTKAPLGKLHTENMIYDLGPGNCPAGYTEGDYDGETDETDCRAIGLVVLENGNIGIGITDPVYKLDIDGNINASGINIEGAEISSGPHTVDTTLDEASVDEYVSNNGFLTSFTEIDPTVNNLGKATLLCGVGQVAKYNGAVWSCTEDNDSGGDITSVNSGLGLTGGNVTGDIDLAVDTTVIQSRVTSTCATGSSIRVINDDGTVDCEVDDTGSSDFWTASGDDIFFDSGNVGVGTTTPAFKLSLDNDGGILARGSFESGNTLAESGGGTRLIWYPRKAAFRVGGVDDNQWDDINIGDYSVGMGRSTKASGYVSTATGSRTTASGSFSIAMGAALLRQGVILPPWETAPLRQGVILPPWETGPLRQGIILSPWDTAPLRQGMVLPPWDTAPLRHGNILPPWDTVPLRQGMVLPPRGGSLLRQVVILPPWETAPLRQGMILPPWGGIQQPRLTFQQF